MRWNRVLGLLLAAAVAGCGGADRRPAAQLYRDNCTRCHGDDGRGDRRSVGLYPGLDLVDSRLLRSGSHGRGQMFQRISTGSDAMPAFGDHMSTEEMEDLIDYILRLSQGKASR